MLKQGGWQRIRDWLHPAFAQHRCHCVVASRKGPRPENQDNYLLIRPDGWAECLQDESPSRWRVAGWKNTWWRLVVADGMGGHKNGREIAQAAIQALPDIPPTLDAACVRDSVRRLHQQLLQAFASPDEKSPGTTLVWVDVHVSGEAVAAYVGDSRLYRWQGHGWNELTHDHTEDEFAWRSAQHESDIYWRTPQKQHQVAQVLGYGSFGALVDAVSGHRPLRFSEALRLDLAEDLPAHARGHADIFNFRLGEGDALMLATDGLWAVPGSDAPRLPAPAELVVSPDGLDRLLWDTLAADGQDNLTSLLLIHWSF